MPIDKELAEAMELLKGLRELKNIFFVVPPVPRPGVFGGVRGDDTWGQSNKSWLEAGPPWVQSGGDIWRRDEKLLDFGGKLTPQLAMDLSKMEVRIIKGSVEDNRWRIAVPEGNFHAQVLWVVCTFRLLHVY